MISVFMKGEDNESAYPPPVMKGETVIFDVFGNSILWSVFSHKSKLYHSIPISDRIMKGVFEKYMIARFKNTGEYSIYGV